MNQVLFTMTILELTRMLMIWLGLYQSHPHSKQFKIKLFILVFHMKTLNSRTIHSSQISKQVHARSWRCSRELNRPRPCPHSLEAIASAALPILIQHYRCVWDFGFHRQILLTLGNWPSVLDYGQFFSHTSCNKTANLLCLHFPLLKESVSNADRKIFFIIGMGV